MAGKETTRFRVADLERWGRLVKSWATQQDYVDQDLAHQPPRTGWVNTSWGNPGKPSAATADIAAAGQPWSLPAMTRLQVPQSGGGNAPLSAVALSRQQFQTLVQAGGVAIAEMPEQYTQVVIVQGGGPTMVMRLPPMDTLQGSEDDLLNGVPYAFSPFYAGYFGNAGTPPPRNDHDGIMRLHASRIGEYTLNNCI